LRLVVAEEPARATMDNIAPPQRVQGAGAREPKPGLIKVAGRYTQGS
jgi:hypothetical protein